MAIIIKRYYPERSNPLYQVTRQIPEGVWVLVLWGGLSKQHGYVKLKRNNTLALEFPRFWGVGGSVGIFPSGANISAIVWSCVVPMDLAVKLENNLQLLLANNSCLFNNRGKQLLPVIPGLVEFTHRVTRNIEDTKYGEN